MAVIKLTSIFHYSLNLGIRGATIGLKFLFTLFLSKFYPEEVLGEYGLFSTTILVSYLLLSLSFDGYAVREIIRKPKEQHLPYIRNVFIYFGIAFLLFVLLGLSFSDQVVIREELIIYFIILLSLETIIQVLFSLFTVLQLPVSANLILFLSQGSWTLLAFLIWIIDKNAIGSVSDILLVWILGSISACIYGISRIRQEYKQSEAEPINWRWIKSGLSTSLLFFIAAFGYKTIEYADRYFIEFKLGTGKLGVYVFYSQIANIMNAVINVTVVLMLYPRLIESYAKGDLKSYLLTKRKMYGRILFLGLGLSIAGTIFIKFALEFIGKEAFYNDVNVFYILLGSNVAMNLSFISHYCLYAMRKDTPLVYTTLAGSVLSLVLNYYLIDILGIEGAALATCSSFILIWLLKSFYVNKAERYEWG